MNEYITLISTISAAIVAAGATILGVWLNNRSNERRLQATLQHDKELKDKEFLREKLEELHEVFADYINLVVLFADSFTKVIRGELSFHDVVKTDVSPVYDVLYSTSKEARRVILLINLYFPNLQEEFDSIRKTIKEFDGIVERYEHDYPDNDETRDSNKFVELSESIGAMADVFDKKMLDIKI